MQRSVRCVFFIGYSLQFQMNFQRIFYLLQYPSTSYLMFRLKKEICFGQSKFIAVPLLSVETTYVKTGTAICKKNQTFKIIKLNNDNSAELSMK